MNKASSRCPAEIAQRAVVQQPMFGAQHHVRMRAVSLTVLCSMQCYEQFIRRSLLGSCILFHEGGHWRELVVRTSQHGHTMAIVTFHPQQLGQVSGAGTALGHPNGCHGALWAYRPNHSFPLFQEALAAQKALLREFFTCGPGAVCALTSLYFQERYWCWGGPCGHGFKVAAPRVCYEASEILG